MFAPFLLLHALPIRPVVPQEEDCALCDKFSGIVKKAKSTIECPPDSQELGRQTWTFLHTTAAYYPEKPNPEQQTAAQNLIQSLTELYPCRYCRDHLRTEIEEDKTKHGKDFLAQQVTNSRRNFEKYMCKIHNTVNENNGKPLFDCNTLKRRWKIGAPECQ